MREQAIKGLLRTLKQIDQERKRRTADLEEAAKVIGRQLLELGHVNGRTGRPGRPKAANSTTTIMTTKAEKRRVRRSPAQLAAEGKAIAAFITAGKDKGRSGAEIRAKYKSIGEGMTIKQFVQKYAGEKITTRGERSKMRYFNMKG
jgi:hypothetical protein